MTITKNLKSGYSLSSAQPDKQKLIESPHVKILSDFLNINLDHRKIFLEKDIYETVEKERRRFHEEKEKNNYSKTILPTKNKNQSIEKCKSCVTLPRNHFIYPAIDYVKFYTKYQCKRETPFMDYVRCLVRDSDANKEVIKIGVENKLLVKDTYSIKYCNSCKSVTINEAENCGMCNSKSNIETFNCYSFHPRVVDVLQHKGEAMEYMCYYALKPVFGADVNANFNLYCGNDLLHELDIIVSGKNKNFVILCTANPENDREKKQAKDSCKAECSVIVVTSHKDAGRMECEKCFSNVLADINFPKNLVDYMKEKVLTT